MGGHSHESQPNRGHSHGGGCPVNGHEDEQEQQINQLDTTRDQICGMIVDPDTAIKDIVNGQTYYFCSESCRKEFIRRQNSL